MNDQFHVATLKLTGWYLAILMVVCLVFSVTLFQISSREFDRPLPPESQQRMISDYSVDQFRSIREQRATESKQAILGNLVMLNLVTLALGAGLSYLFARRTLRPVEEAMEAQAQFTSDASHELRTPLAVMRTENEIALREKKPTIAGLTSAVKSNLEELERLQQLTDRLLALSSSQSLPLSSFHVSVIIDEVYARQQQQAAQKHITITTRINGKRLSATGNGESVCDIVSILVDNAVKYSPAKSTVHLMAGVKNNTVEICIIDEGPGIEDADKERIFDRFYRGDQSRSKQHVEGHGLGLALAQRLAELNKGQLRVADAQPKGTIFTLVLEKASSSTH